MAGADILLANFFKPQTLSQAQGLLQERCLRISQRSGVRAEGSVKTARVALEARGARGLVASCTCSGGRRGQACKHIAAALMELGRVQADLVQDRVDLDVSGEAKSRESYATFPDDVTESLRYFADNGFALDGPEDLESLAEAKKKLARIFHPDRGGTHAEAVTLNAHYQNLLGYVNNKK